MEYKDFEKASQRLEQIVAELEKGELALEKAMKLFEEGLELSQFCARRLEDAEPAVIHRAMRYSVFAGGKRLRPILALATGEALAADPDGIRPLAATLELIHTYSLIHDDLPAMDDDDYRRGVPTLHREFGEGIAILAGNGLLTLAFRLLAEMEAPPVAQGTRLAVIATICRAVGTEGGLIGGQVVDLTTEGKAFTRSRLEYIHSAKTGALLRASVEAAAMLAGADSAAQARLAAFGSKIGLAFQVVDDVLDVDGSRRELGKSSGKDEADRKATYPALFGLEESRRIAARLVEQAEAELDFLGGSGEVLRRLARFVTDRRS